MQRRCNVPYPNNDASEKAQALFWLLVLTDIALASLALVSLLVVLVVGRLW